MVEPFTDSQNSVRGPFTTQDYLVDIYEFISPREMSSVIQYLSKAYYYNLVPKFVKQVLCHHKLVAKHEFVNIFRTMNAETHKFRAIDWMYQGLIGRLTGEFLESPEKPLKSLIEYKSPFFPPGPSNFPYVPDGRCIF